MLKEGDYAPDFELPITDGSESKFEDLVGSKGLIFFFYPKDLTPGCTQEASDFQSNLSLIQKQGFNVVGISKDSVNKHQKFADKMSLIFPLISDESTELCDFFGVWKEKSLYGRTFMGIERSTFVVDNKGLILKVYNKVRVKGHVERVIEDLGDL